MKKRCLTALLALTMVLAVLPTGVWAASAAESPTTVGETVLSDNNLWLYHQLKEKNNPGGPWGPGFHGV